MFFKKTTRFPRLRSHSTIPVSVLPVSHVTSWGKSSLTAPPPRDTLQQIHPAHHLVLPGLQATSQPEGLCIGLYVCTLCWVWLFATPQTVACQAPLSMRFPQAKILEWVAISFSRASSRTGIKTTSLATPALACIFFTSWATGEALELLCLLIYPSPLLLEYPLHRSCLPCSLLPF